MCKLGYLVVVLFLLSRLLGHAPASWKPSQSYCTASNAWKARVWARGRPGTLGATLVVISGSCSRLPPRITDSIRIGSGREWASKQRELMRETIEKTRAQFRGLSGRQCHRLSSSRDVIVFVIPLAGQKELNCFTSEEEECKLITGSLQLVARVGGHISRAE